MASHTLLSTTKRAYPLYNASALMIASNDPDASTFDPGEVLGTTGKVEFQTEFGFTTLSQAINTITSAVFFIAALAAFMFILMGAFQYVTAGDDTSKTEKSRKIITNAVVGLILVALVYVVFQIAIQIVPGVSDWFVVS